MSSEFDRGVFRNSTWHRLEKLAEMPDADAMIAEGQNSGAWPQTLRRDKLRGAETGLMAPLEAIIGDYRNHASRVLGCVTDSYRETMVDEWTGIVRAACAAGAKPSGAFSLRDGTRILATFDITPSGDVPEGTRASGIKTHLLMCDSFDRSMKMAVGTTGIDVVCANTLSMALREDGAGMGRFRHTASLAEKVKILQERIGESAKTGRKVRDLMLKAEHTVLTRQAAHRAFDLLWPAADKDAEPAQVTRAENLRKAARIAATLPINRAGSRPATLATLWNTATYLVDRTHEGQFRPTRGGDPLDSMVFGTRADRVREVQTLMEVILADGSVRTMPAPDAIAAGVDSRIVGAAVLDELVPGYRD